MDKGQSRSVFRDSRSADWIPVKVLFLPPYRNDSDDCTGVRLIRAGLATEVPAISAGMLILHPGASRVLVPADRDLVRRWRLSLTLIDGPWEGLEVPAGGTVPGEKAEYRVLPSGLRPFNPYYRSLKPLRFPHPARFTTAEALLAALLILGRGEQAERVACLLDYAPAFLEGNKSVLTVEGSGGP